MKPNKYELLENGNFVNTTSNLTNENEFITHVNDIHTISIENFIYKIFLSGNYVDNDSKYIIQPGHVGVMKHYDISNNKPNRDPKIKVISVSVDNIGYETIIDVLSESLIMKSTINDVLWNTELIFNEIQKYEEPKNIFVTDLKDDELHIGLKQVTVHWDKNSLANSYVISYRKHTDNDNLTWTYISEIYDNKYIIDSLDINTSYGICIMSLYENRTSKFSNETVVKL